MSCLFDALASALRDRAGLLRHARYEPIRSMPTPVTGAALRAALCDVMPAVRVHGTPLVEWGAMEAGGAPEAYARHMREASTWGGGVELATFAAAFRLPVIVESAAGTFAFGERYASHAAPIRVRYDGAHYTPA
jgi:hypothetical protein